jgi:hypothetical protein
MAVLRISMLADSGPQCSCHFRSFELLISRGISWFQVHSDEDLSDPTVPLLLPQYVEGVSGITDLTGPWACA